MNAPDVHFHIEELILHGLPGVNRAAVGVAVQQELTRLLTERGVPPSLAAGGHVPTLDGGTFTVPPGARPGAIGTRIAQAVYGGLKP